MRGMEDAVRRHLARGVHVNSTDEHGRTALILAAGRGHPAICRILLDAGADRRLRDDSGLDADTVAHALGHADIADMLAAERPSRVAPVQHASPKPLSTAAETPDVRDDESEWEVEAEPRVPDADGGAIRESMQVQQAIAEHTPIDRDADWQDVAIRLPQVRVRRGREVLSEDALNAWRALVLDGLRRGAVSTDQVLGACYAMDRDDDDAEGLLGQVLEEAGVRIDEDNLWWALGGPDNEVEDNDVDDAADTATDRLLALLQDRSRVYWSYVASMPSKRVAREDEEGLGMAMEAGQDLVVDALVRSPRLTDLLPSPAADGVACAVDPLASVVAELLDVVGGIRRGVRAGTATRRAASAARAAIARLVERLARDGLAGKDVDQIGRGYQLWHTAWSRMVLGNLRLVLHTVRRGWHGGVPTDDLVQQGNLGLMRAAEKYDPRVGSGFGTYAAWWIRARIQRYVTQSPVVSMSGDASWKRNRMLEAQRHLDANGKPKAGIDEIAEAAGLGRDAVLHALAHGFTFVGLPNDPMDDEADDLVDDAAPDPEQLAVSSELLDALRLGIDQLKPKHARVLRLRFGLDDNIDRTLAEVGQVVDLSRERVRQLEREALSELRSQHGLDGELPPRRADDG